MEGCSRATQKPNCLQRSVGSYSMGIGWCKGRGEDKCGVRGRGSDEMRGRSDEMRR